MEAELFLNGLYGEGGHEKKGQTDEMRIPFGESTKSNWRPVETAFLISCHIFIVFFLYFFNFISFKSEENGKKWKNAKNKARKKSDATKRLRFELIEKHSTKSRNPNCMKIEYNASLITLRIYNSLRLTVSEGQSDESGSVGGYETKKPKIQSIYLETFKNTHFLRFRHERHCVFSHRNAQSITLVSIIIQ